jgi:hypothetical protein
MKPNRRAYTDFLGRHQIARGIKSSTVWITAGLALFGLTSCAHLDPDPQYEVNAAGGPFLINWSGFDVSYSHSTLDAMIRRGVEQAGCGTVVQVAPAGTAPTKRIVLYLSEDSPRHTNAHMTAQLFDDSHRIASAGTVTPSPGVVPRAVFIRNVAELTRRVLPPAG